jgi:hypothetical protein
MRRTERGQGAGQGRLAFRPPRREKADECGNGLPAEAAVDDEMPGIIAPPQGIERALQAPKRDPGDFHAPSITDLVLCRKVVFAARAR